MILAIVQTQKDYSGQLDSDRVGKYELFDILDDGTRELRESGNMQYHSSLKNLWLSTYFSHWCPYEDQNKVQSMEDYLEERMTKECEDMTRRHGEIRKELQLSRLVNVGEKKEKR